MFLMYVDESGDIGLSNSPTRYFILSGLIIHELRWKTQLDILIKFRRHLRDQYTFKLREEFHSSYLISKPGKLARINKFERLAIIRKYAKILSSMGDLSIINIIVDKSGKPAGYNVFENAWRALIQRFENTISHHNFPGPQNPDERGLLICDHTDDKKLMKMIRKLRRYNPVPHQNNYGQGYRNIPLQYIIEDPNFRDSQHSYFIQTVDLIAYLLLQYESPNKYMRKKSANNYFRILDPILCKVASTNDPFGIVRL